MDPLFYFHHLQLAMWQSCDIVVKIGVVLDLLLLREDPVEPFHGDFVCVCVCVCLSLSLSLLFLILRVAFFCLIWEYLFVN